MLQDSHFTLLFSNLKLWNLLLGQVVTASFSEGERVSNLTSQVDVQACF